MTRRYLRREWTSARRGFYVGIDFGQRNRWRLHRWTDTTHEDGAGDCVLYLSIQRSNGNSDPVFTIDFPPIVIRNERLAEWLFEKVY